MPFELVSPVINGLVENRFLSDTSIVRRLYTHSTAQCTLDTDDITAQDYASLSALGSNSLNAEVLLRWHSKDLTETVDCFRGYVCAVRAERVQDRSYINLECVSTSARLDQVRNFRVWERCTLQDICSYIINKNRNDLAFGEDGESLTSSIPIPLSVQYDETDFAYLTRMLHAWGVPLAVDDLNRKVYIGKPKVPGGSEFPAVDWHWERVTMDADLVAIQTTSQGSGDAAPGIARSKTQEFNGVLSRTPGHLYAPKLDEEHQEAHRQMQQHEDETKFNTGSVVCRAQWLGGVFEYSPGVLADFAGQQWLVREVSIQSHDEKGTSEWVSQEFTLLDKLMPLIPLHRRVPWPAHCLWAHVTQNNNQDPAQRGHIQVQFDWEPDESTNTQHCWLPTVTPYGGLKGTSGTSGFLSLPEIGEHVLVQFLDAWDSAAVVIGSIREHPAEGFSYCPHETKRWQTPSGNQVSMTTRDDGKTDIVEIRCKDKLIFRGEIEPGKETVVMDLTSSGDDRIHFEKGSGPAQLDIFCSGNIYMHAAQQMMIEAGQIQIKSTMGPVKIDGTPLVMLNCGPTSMSPLKLDTSASSEGRSTANAAPSKGTAGAANGGTVKSSADAKRQQDITALLNKSAIGKDAVKYVEDHKIPVEFHNGGGSYWDGKRIVIDRTESTHDAALTMVHEVNHARNDLEHTSASLVTDKRDAYVEKLVKEEAIGTVKSIKTKQELLAAGEDVSTASFPLENEYQAAHNKAVDSYKKSHPDASPSDLAKVGDEAGTDRVIQGFNKGEVVTSNTNEKYGDYYGKAWDKQNKKP